MFTSKYSAQKLFKTAQKMGWQPEWHSNYGFFTVRVDKQVYPVFYTKSSLNNQLSTWLTDDKYATHVWLEQHDYPQIPYLYRSTDAELKFFLQKHQAVIIKPVIGQQSRHVRLFSDTQNVPPVTYENDLVEKYIAGTEYRCLLLQHKVVGVQRRDHFPTLKQPWKKQYHNLTEPDFPNNIIDKSRQISLQLQQGWLAVDWICDQEQRWWILEINSSPGIYFCYHPHSGPVIDVAPAFLQASLQRQRDAGRT